MTFSPLRVRLVDEALQRLGAAHPLAVLVLEAQRALHRQAVHAQVAPVAAALHLVDGQQLQRVDAQLLEVVQLRHQVLDRRAIRVPRLAQEAAHVELVHHPLVVVRLARRAVVLPGEAGRVRDDRAAERHPAPLGDSVAPPVVVAARPGAPPRCSFAVPVRVVPQLQLALRVLLEDLELVAQTHQLLRVVHQRRPRPALVRHLDAAVVLDVLRPEVVELPAVQLVDQRRVEARPVRSSSASLLSRLAARVLEHQVRAVRVLLVVDVEAHQLAARRGRSGSPPCPLRRVQVEPVEAALLAHHLAARTGPAGRS